MPLYFVEIYVRHGDDFYQLVWLIFSLVWAPILFLLMNHSQRFKIKEFNQGSKVRFPGDDNSPKRHKKAPSPPV